MASSNNSSTTSVKPKRRDSQRVTFAQPNDAYIHHSSPTERTPLLGDASTRPEDTNDDEEAEEAVDQVGTLPLPSRLHRKFKKGLLVSGSKVKRAGRAVLPIHRPRHPDEEEEEVTTQKVLLYSVLALILVAVVLGGAVLIQSADKLPTGPYPHPPTPTYTSSATEEPAHKPSSTAKPPIFPPYPFPSGLPRNQGRLVNGVSGGVATEHETCSQIGVDILRAGGSAVDAAIAGTLCIGTVNMFSSGIGGGGFMTVRVPPSSHKSGASKVWTIDFRETIPAAGNATMFQGDPLKMLFGGLSVGVPGELKGMAEAHRRWGRLPWKALVLPSAELAEGWIVGKELERRLTWLGGFMLTVPEWSAVFAPNGTLLKEGDIVRRPTYAQTLRTIAEQGVDAFYSSSSPIAQAIIKKVQQEGGIMTLKDLEQYTIRVERALEGTYRGKKVYTTGAPSSGPALLHMLHLLEGFDLAKRGDTELSLHRVVEVLKFGFAARTRIGDPNTKEDVKRMADIPSRKLAQKIFPRITDTTHPPEYYEPIFGTPEDHGTTHVSTIDKDGMAVSLTSTVNLIWGSRMMDPLGDFSLPGVPDSWGLWPSPYNLPDAGRRPLSSIAPTILEHESGEVFLALGASGGSRILGAILQVIIHHLDLGMDISAAVEQPRVHDQLFPLETSIESTFWAKGLEDLARRGHNITIFDINQGVSEVQAVSVDLEGKFTAASDSRKNGIAVAY